MKSTFTILAYGGEMRYANTSDFSKRRVHLFWLGFISRLGLLFGVPFLIYYGYCWGVWGRNSLLFQYLFQCACPTSSEEWRYPEEIDVLVSACHKSRVDLSPSGRFLAVYQDDSLSYLLDLLTMERLIAPQQRYSTFLTDDMGFRQYPDPVIVDRTTGNQYPIEKYIYLHRDAYVNGNADTVKLAEALREAKYVYFIDEGTDAVVALVSDSQIDSKQNFFANRFDLPGFSPNRVELFLQENNIVYQTIGPRFPHEVVSPDGRLIARDDGIYLVETNQMIVKAPLSFIMGWTNHSQGAIYYLGSRCLIPGFLPFADDTWCEIDVSQSILLLKVPEEYLFPTPAP